MVVGIIGVLAAVGIPAYQKYQNRAELGVVQSTVNQIRKAFQTCMSVNSRSTCQTDGVDGTIEFSSDLESVVGGADDILTCWLVEKGEFTGCVGFNGRSFAGSAFGAPSGISCSNITPTCSSTTASCTGGCTVKTGTNGCDASGPKTGNDCGTGTTNAPTVAKCGSGNCSL